MKKCDWCGVELTDENLYSYSGYGALCGPICKDCVSRVKDENKNVRIWSDKND